MKAKEHNPEIRPSCELPLFEQSFTDFEQSKSALPEIEKVPKGFQGEPSVALNPCNGTRSRHIAAQSQGEQAHARKSDPETSHAASRSVVNLGRTRDAILKILSSGPRTDEQIAESYTFGCQRLNWPKRTPSGLRSRRSELVSMGFVEAAGGFNDDGTTWGITGKTASKRNCIVWKLK